MTGSSRNSIYEIRDKLELISTCSTIDIYFNRDGSIDKITNNKMLCKMGMCNPIEWWLTTLTMISLGLTIIGLIIVLLFYGNPRNFQHITMKLHYNKENRDSVTNIYRYFSEYYDAKCLLNIKMLESKN
jgi:hypothetical protein